jgi:vacuolar-type H+-ATPase subunit F/Vma7
MSQIAGLGELSRLEVYRLAGVGVLAAETDDDVRTAWQSLTEDTLVVLLTPRAAAALGNAVAEPGVPMTVVLPS